jgi:hypothetical protein
MDLREQATQAVAHLGGSHEGCAEFGRIDLWVGRITKRHHATVEDNPSIARRSLAASSLLGSSPRGRTHSFNAQVNLRRGHGMQDNVLDRYFSLEYVNLITQTGPDHSRVATNQPLTAGVDLSYNF